MPVTVTRRQTRSVQPPAIGTTTPLYRVVDECTGAVGVTQAIYVFLTATREFSHVAVPSDLVLYGTDASAAGTQRKTFYRAASVTRDFPSAPGAKAFASDLDVRVQYLCDTYDAALVDFLGDGEPKTITLTSRP